LRDKTILKKGGYLSKTKIWRPRIASKVGQTAKARSGYRVQSLPCGTWPPMCSIHQRL